MANAEQIRAAAVQFAPGGDREANLAALAESAREAAGRGATLVVAPEYSARFAGAPDAAAVAAAEPLDGPFVSGLGAIAADLGVWLVAGLLERRDGGLAANAVVAVGPDGGLGAVYRKEHLYDAFGSRESDAIEPGEPGQAAVINVDGFRVGLQTCYDLRFPESTRVLADAGADIVAVPAQWVPGPGKERHWSTLLAARAIENTLAVVAADHAAPSGVGGSAVLGPDGVVLAGLGSRPGLVVAGVARADLDAARAASPVLSQRRYRVTPRG